MFDEEKFWDEFNLDNLDFEKDLPIKSDRWNASISEITEFDHVKVASFITTALYPPDINMMIIVFPGMKRQDILDDWQKIIEYRDNLSKAFGKVKRPELLFRQNAFRLHRDYKMGYGSIANFLNFHIVGLFLHGLYKKKSDPYESDYYIWFCVIDHLIAFGYSKEDAIDYIDLVSERLSKKKFPWKLNDGTFSSSLIRNHIRELVRQDKESSLILKRNMLTLDTYILDSGVYEYIKELYVKTFELSNSERRSFNNWEKIKKQLYLDFLNHITEFFVPDLPDMGDLN